MSRLLIIVIVALVIIILATGYVKAPPDHVYIITGGGKQPKYLVGKAGIRIPYLQRVDKLSLQMLSVDVKTSKTIPTLDYININVDAVAVVKISNTPDGIARASENFLNKDTEYINQMVSNVLEGNLREIIGSMDLRTIMNDRQTFAQRVQQNAEGDMKRMGLEVVSFNIQNIDDDKLGVIDNLGIANTTAIRKDAEISQANAEKEISIAKAAAHKAANDANVAAETAIAEQNNALALKQAELKTSADIAAAKAAAAGSIEEQRQQKTINAEQVNADIMKTEREAELKQKEVDVRKQELAAQVERQADAERYAAEQKAEAERITRQKQADAELYASQKAAEAIEAKGKAEAEAARMKGFAEAEAMSKRADALKKYGSAALAQQIIGYLPEIIAAAAKPIGDIDSINIYSAGGNADGTGTPTDAVTGIAPQSIKAAFDMVKSVTGVDLADVMRSDTYEAKVNRNVTIEGTVPVSTGHDTDDKGRAENAGTKTGNAMPFTEARNDSTEDGTGKRLNAR